MQRLGAAVTENSPQDGDIFKYFTTAQVMDDFPEPGPVVFDAISSSAVGANQARLHDKIVDNKIAAFDGGKVDGKAGCKYTADNWVRQTGGVTKQHR